MPTLRSTAKYVPKENEYICLLKDIYKNVDSSCIHNSQKLETAQMPFSRRMNEETVVYSHVETLHISLKNELLIHKKHSISWILVIVSCERSYKVVPIVYTHKRICCLIPFTWSSWTGKANQWWRKSQHHNWLPLGLGLSCLREPIGVLEMF